MAAVTPTSACTVQLVLGPLLGTIDYEILSGALLQVGLRTCRNGAFQFRSKEFRNTCICAANKLVMTRE